MTPDLMEESIRSSGRDGHHTSVKCKIIACEHGRGVRHRDSGLVSGHGRLS